MWTAQLLTTCAHVCQSLHASLGCLHYYWYWLHLECLSCCFWLLTMLQLLEGIFPRHILEYLTLQGGDSQQQLVDGCGGGMGGGAAGGGFGLVAGALAAQNGRERMATLATSHSCVTILFTGTFILALLACSYQWCFHCVHADVQSHCHFSSST